MDKDQILRQKEYLDKLLLDYEQKCENLDSLTGEPALAVRIKAILKIADQFQNLLKELLTIDPENEKKHAEFGVTFESRLIEVESKYRNRLAQIQKAGENIDDEDNSHDNLLIKLLENQNNLIEKLSNPKPVVHSSQGRLPTIHLEKFDGKTKEYVRFRQRFDAVVQSHNLTEGAKYWYLNQALTGEPLDLISSLEYDDNSYTTARKVLDDRYEQKRIIVNSHIQALFDAPQMKDDSHVALRQLISEFTKQMKYLEQQKIPVHQWDLVLIILLSSKLHRVTRAKIEEKLSSTDLPTWVEFKKFLEERSQVLEAIEQTKPNRNSSFEESKKPNYTKSSSSKPSVYAHTSSNDNNDSHVQSPNSAKKLCVFCKSNHFSNKCYKFVNLSAQDKLKRVIALKLCHNCLKSDHVKKDCKSQHCFKCPQKHNTLLHDSFPNASGATRDSSVTTALATDDQKTTSSPEGSAASNSFVCAHSTDNHQVLLATAELLVRNNKNNLVKCRALLDCGSQSNFISMDFLESLKLPSRKISMAVKGIGSSSSCITRMVTATVQSRINAFEAKLDLAVLSSITGNLPERQLNIDKIDMPQNIHLADPNFDKPAKIDVLLGVELFFRILMNRKVDLLNHYALLQETQFGWIVAGRFVTDDLIRSNPINSFQTTIETLSRQMQRFWTIEHYDEPSSSVWSPEEQKCEAHFKQNYRREANGRFVVKLPFKKPPALLGSSFNSALASLLRMEKKFETNLELKRLYVEFMEEYQMLGHMRSVDINVSVSPHYYIPHLPVLRMNSVTTKLRTVFNASCKTSKGNSLNDILMVGPTIQDDLWSILLRFRLHRFVMTSDITKMYRQIRVDEECQPLQRILWRCEPQQPIQAFELTTVTYGTAPASFLATRCLKQLASDGAQLFPDAVKMIDDFYVDDLMTGSNSLQQALRMQKQIIELLQSGGFELHKWSSNHSSLLDSIESRNESTVLSIDEDDSIKLLGLLWNPVADVFSFNVNENPQESVTKRIILSDISKIFDPLGLVGPVIVHAKLIMRLLWTLKLGWDQEVSNELRAQWISYRDSLRPLNSLKIPRWLHYQPCNAFEIFGFCDASELAYGAVIYLRTINDSGEICCNLYCSKSRVAPLKATTIPRLELCSAQLLAQLVNKVIHSMRLPSMPVHLWSDSTIVLSWLQASPSRLKTFVGNRVAEIQRTTEKFTWRHVQGKENPADLISRGVESSKFIESNLWWNGPEWAYSPQPPEFLSTSSNDDEYLTEFRTTVSLFTIESTCGVFEHFSSAENVIRTIAIWMKYFKKLRTAAEKRKSNSLTNETAPLESLTNVELEAALIRCVKLVQAQCFKKEISELTKHKKVNKRSNLACLRPFLDSDRIIRVLGRLEKSNLNYDEKHQIVMPNKHKFMRLLAEREHLRHMHCGPSLMLSSIRRRFWPVRGYDLCKQVVNQCTTCFRANPRPIIQPMGQLPEHRVQQARPFVNSGVDYCGPFMIKSSMLRKAPQQKAYVAIFVCMAVKAVHIELVGDLTSQAFIASLKRFISRRGMCQTIYSDNGSNFIGANRELHEFYQWLANDSIQAQITSDMQQKSIQWKFNPPYAPHRGGLWEAGVKRIKYHLRRVMNDHVLTYEEFNSLLIEIEAILNSRPLIPLTSNPSDLQALTPGHFIIGEALTAPVQIDLTSSPMNRLNRFEFLTQLKQSFWKVWQHDYLQSLQKIPNKWTQDPIELKLNDLVLIQLDNQPTLQWPLGRIVKLNVAKDGVVRTVDVRTAGGIKTRAVQRVCLLPDETSARFHGGRC